MENRWEVVGTRLFLPSPYLSFVAVCCCFVRVFRGYACGLRVTYFIVISAKYSLSLLCYKYS